MNRRSFLQTSLLAPAVSAATTGNLTDRICVFTDHLGGMPYADVARMLRELNTTGPDLTVRAGGLVTPQRVAEDLPRMHRALQDIGLSIPMMTTDVRTARDPVARNVLATASKLGIRYYRPDYYAYKDLAQFRERITEVRRELQGLAALNQELGLQATMHNHSGESVGCAIWDLLEALEGVNPKYVGMEFDPSHAMIEGGKFAWQLNFQRAASRTVVFAIKDYIWEKTAKGWRTRWVPLGEGMVQWPAVFNMIRATPFPGPITLHMEYVSTQGSLKERYDRSLQATARDLAFLRKGLSQAG